MRCLVSQLRSAPHRLPRPPPPVSSSIAAVSNWHQHAAQRQAHGFAPGDYDKAFEWARSDPISFWETARKSVDWFEEPTEVLRENPPFNTWFPGGKTNLSYNALDRHIEAGNGDKVALIYDSPVTGVVEKYTYKELHELVSRFAGVLRNNGVEEGDRVVIYMPNSPQAAITMLACSRIGAVHVVVFGGFAANQLATRIEHVQPKVVVASSCGVEPTRIVHYLPLVDEAISLCKHKPQKVIVYQRENVHKAELKDGFHTDWDHEMDKAKNVDSVPLESSHSSYIIHTSGTTGTPKGVLRDVGGYATALAWSMKNIYNVHPDDVFWAASDVGWVVGHSYIVYGPLIHGMTTVMYEGKPVGTPDAGAFWRVCSDYNVKTLFVAPTALRAIKKEDPDGSLIKSYDMSNFDTLFLAGERADPSTVMWAQKVLDRRVIDHWWQTETGWPISSTCAGIDTDHPPLGSAGRPVPGYHLHVLDDDHNPVKPGESGSIAVKLPLPPGTFKTLYEADDLYHKTYFSKFPGYYQTGDNGFVCEDGWVRVMSREDDVINVAGHRLSTGEMEEVVGLHEDVAECAVIGAADSLKGEIPLALVVAKAGRDRNADELEAELIASVRETIGPVASFKNVHVVKMLPKTRSGKILRKSIRQIINGEECPIPPTIEDPASLAHIAEVTQKVNPIA